MLKIISFIQSTRFGILLILSLFVLAACNTSGDEVASAPTATLAPIVSLTPRATSTPVPTRTPLPTFTPTPSDTPIPLTPTNTPLPTATPPIIGIINSLQTVNIRSGPGISFRAIEALPPGTGVEVLGQDPNGNWFNIRMEDGDEGWVAASLLRIQDTPTPEPTLTPTPNLTAILQGTPLPTALFGEGTVTPTPPSSIATPTVVDLTAAAADRTLEADDLLFIPIITPTDSSSNADDNSTDDVVIDLDSINQTATALATGINPQITSVPVDIAQLSTTAPTTIPTQPPPTPTPSTIGGPGSASLQQGSDVLAYCNDPSFGRLAPTFLRDGATIDVFWAWFAKTEEQLQDHIDNVNYEVRVNGVLLEDWRDFQQPIEVRQGNFWVFWFVPFGPLEAGDYEITYVVTWDRAISDGIDDFGPGTDNPFQTGNCTFTVAEG
ncbi:MAG: hypothetical protein D6737_08640 [Chloroflexi bacterium]|nr:MAG: hypothetical protein D6737_08640 [Chloroflexota bacterium]